MSTLVEKKSHASTSTMPGRMSFAKDETRSIKMINEYMEGQKKLMTKIESDQ